MSERLPDCPKCHRPMFYRPVTKSYRCELCGCVTHFMEGRLYTLKQEYAGSESWPKH